MLEVSNTRHIERGREDAARADKPAQGQLQVVLVFQGGGALGAYQAGVYQALHESGMEPDWIIGTSIGAINASLIAGNEPEHRLDRLEEFWRRMRRNEFWGLSNWPGLADTTSYWSTLLGGIPGFFEPNPLAFLGAHYPLGRDKAGFYSTALLEKTLTELVDFSLIARCTPRLTVGAAHVRTARCATSTAARPRLRPGMSWRRARCRPLFHPHRRRALLGWRDSLQHADRGDFRRQPAPQFTDLRGAYVESHGTRARDDLGSAPPAQGHPVLEPRRESHRATTSGAQAAPRDFRTGQIDPRGRPQGPAGEGSGRVWLLDAHACRATARTSLGQ